MRIYPADALFSRQCQKMAEDRVTGSIESWRDDAGRMSKKHRTDGDPEDRSWRRSNKHRLGAARNEDQNKDTSSQWLPRQELRRRGATRRGALPACGPTTTRFVCHLPIEPGDPIAGHVGAASRSGTRLQPRGLIQHGGLISVGG